MKIGVLGTGMVGDTLGTKMVQLGHEVKMGSRTANNAKATAWAKRNGAKASHGTFEEAGAFGEIIFHATSGENALAALQSAGKKNLSGKIIVDISNSLDFSKGMPPTLKVCNDDSLGEQIQREFPDSKVVKTLNLVTCGLMVDPGLVKGDMDMFVAGNDASAKAQVTKVLKDWFGWKNITDLGDLTGARAMEMLLPMWLRLYGIYQNPNFGFKILRNI